MNFQIKQATEILERTPVAISSLLSALSTDWITNNEGAGTWSPFEVVGHLIDGEKTDWIPRMRIILSDKPDKHFVPFNMAGMFEEVKGKSMSQLLEEFIRLRAENIRELRQADLSEEQLLQTGIHPEFGEVTLKQHLATWVAHDLAHIAQIARVMAKQYKGEVGPWIQYLSILKK